MSKFIRLVQPPYYFVQYDIIYRKIDSKRQAYKVENSYCIVPTSSAAFWQLADYIDLSSEAKEIFLGSFIEKVYIDSNQGKWDIRLKVPQLLDSGSLDLISRKICSGCKLRQVQITQYLDNPQLTQQIKQAVFNYIHEHYLVNMPKSVLSDIYVQLPDVHIIVIGEITLDLFRQPEIKRNLEQYLLDHFAYKTKIFFRKSLDNIKPLHAVELSCTKPKHTPQTQSELRSVPTPVSNILWGRMVKGEVKNIADINQEENKLIVIGRICNFKQTELRTKRILVSFDVVDNTDGLSCKIFFKDAQEFQTTGNKITDGVFAQVCGNVAPDKFAGQELVMNVLGIKALPEEFRMDNAPEKRVELHLHTRMSSMDSLLSVSKMIKSLSRWKHTAVAVTDHGVVQAFPETYLAAAKAGIKLIYGMEGYLIDENNPDRTFHIILLVKDQVGLKNLYQLVTLSHLKHFYKRPRLPREAIIAHREGLIIGSACEAGELYRAILNKVSEEQLLQIADFYDYLEIQPIANNSFLIRKGLVADENELRSINKYIYELGQKLHKAVVATCDVHFLNPEDEVYRRILMAGQGYEDADLQPPLYLRTTEEMLAEFAYLGERIAKEVVIDNPQQIAAQTQSFKPLPDELYPPKIEGAEETVRNMAETEMNNLYAYQGQVPQYIVDRLEMELHSIISNGFAVLYLTAQKLVKKSLDDGYLVGSRGSVGSSFVATMMQITEVNPLLPHWRCPDCKFSEFIEDASVASGFDLPPKDCPHCGAAMVRDGHNIPFAVFLGFHGDKVPDIDLNFSGEYQPKAHKYTEELFGKDNVFRAGTISTLADKTAYGFVKKYHEGRQINVREAKINALVAGCTGVKRTTGQHPGGVMVVPRDVDIHLFTPLQHPADDRTSDVITTHFDYHSINDRLVKLDILGHDDPTVIRMLEDLTGLNARLIPINDEKTMSLFSNCEALGINEQELGSTVGTFGIPEFGTKFVRQMLEDIKPSKFSELVRVSGFSHGTDVWLNNAQDIIRNGVADVSETISARDDIMVYLINKGLEPSHAFKIMESVRKGKGVSDEQAKEMLANNVPDWYLASCRKIKYMFPRAHAVAYVIMAYRIAYCKVYYPLAFYAAYFSIRGTEFDSELITNGREVLKAHMRNIENKGNEASTKEKNLFTIMELALEMLLRGYDFLKVDLYKSAANRFQIVDNKLLPPLSTIQGLGGSAADSIVKAREHGDFTSKQNLAQRARVSKSVIDKLVEYGAVGELPDTDQITLF